MPAINGFVKTLTVSTVKWSKIAVGESGPQLVPQPDKHYAGTVSKVKAKANILKELGQDADIFIVDVVTEVKRYEMDLDTFLTHAVEICANEKPTEAEPDENSGDEGGASENGT